MHYGKLITKGDCVICGLFGAISNTLSDNEIALVRTAGALSFLRGTHSTGVAACYKGKKKHFEYAYDKDTVDPYSYLFDDRTINELKQASAIIGHCRHATVGKVSVDNAHPYECGHIIGAHNGTVFSLNAEATKQNTTDSHLIFKMIAEKGIDETVQKLGANAAYALTWFDTKENTLNLLHNKERPLYIMKGPGTVYWASEGIFLALAGSRSSCKVESPESVPVDTLFTFNLHNMKLTSREVKYTPPPTVITTAMDVMKRSFSRNQQHVRHDTSTNTSVVPFIPSSTHKPPTNTDSLPVGHVRTRFKYAGSVTRNTIDNATTLFPGHVGDYPSSIEMEDGTRKYLRYYHPVGKYMMPDLISETREQGCLITKRQALMTTPMWWVNTDEWVTAPYKDDAFVLEYFFSDDSNPLKEFDAPVTGRWVYSTLNTLTEREQAISRALNTKTIETLHKTIN